MNKIKKLENKFLEVFKETFLEKGSRLNSCILNNVIRTNQVQEGETHFWEDNAVRQDKIIRSSSLDLDEYIPNFCWMSDEILTPVHNFGFIKDRFIVKSLLGVITKIDGDNLITESFLDSQKIKADYKHAIDTGLTIEKLILAREMFLNNEIEEDLYCVLSQYQLNRLYKTTDIYSEYFNEIQSIITGKSNSLLGFNIIRVKSGILPIKDNIRKVVCFARSSFSYYNKEDFSIEILSQPTYNAPVFNLKMSGTFSGIKLDNKKVVEIECYEV